MGIDLSTANTLVYVKGRGIVLNEPSVVALTTQSGKREVLSVGEEAMMMLEPHARQHPGDPAAARRRHRRLRSRRGDDQALHLEGSQPGRSFAHPQIVVCVPSGSTAPSKRRAIQESAESAGARKCG